MAAPWTAFYWRDYTSKTRHLSLMEHGAYFLLLAHYYSTGMPLPCLKQCLRIACAVLPEEQQAVESVLYQFFSTEEDGTHRNSRCDDEIAKATAYSESCDKRARAGAAAKWKDHVKKDASSIPSSNAKPMLNTCLADAQPQPQPYKDQSLSSDQSSDGLPLSELKRKQDEKIPVQRVFAYYCQTIGKSAAYLLTDQRLKQGIARFRESSKLAVALKPGLAIEDVPDACEKLMMVAIDEMAKDDWAMGRDKNSKKTFNEWNNLFRSAEQYQKWVNLRFGARLSAPPLKPVTPENSFAARNQ